MSWHVWLLAWLLAGLIAALVTMDRQSDEGQSDEGCELAPLEMRSLASDLNSFWRVTVRLCPLSKPTGDVLGFYDRGVVYIQLGELHYYDKQGLPDGIGLMHVMGHEWGHHVQSFRRSEYGDRPEYREIAEAQANCLSGYFIASKYPGLTKSHTESLFGLGGTPQRYKAMRSGYLGKLLNQAAVTACGPDAARRCTNQPPTP